MICPICDSKLTRDYFHANSMVGTEESSYRCENCSLYHEVFAYGATEILIGDFTTNYSHNTPKENFENLRKKMNVLIELYKKERSNEKE